MTLAQALSAHRMHLAARTCHYTRSPMQIRCSAKTEPHKRSLHTAKRTTTISTSTSYVETVDVQITRESPLSSFNRYRALVLDTSYRPIDIVNWQRAICLDLFDKVDVLEYYDALVHSARAEFMIPAVLRVRMYVQRDNRGRISLTRRNLMLRDNSTCQYCGSHHDLTVDHVTPVSKGGLWEWSNLVTACNTCNAKKGSRSLKQLGWMLRKLPAAPTSWQLGILVGMDREMRNSPKEWAEYLFPGQEDANVAATAAAAAAAALSPLDPL